MKRLIDIISICGATLVDGLVLYANSMDRSWARVGFLQVALVAGVLILAVAFANAYHSVCALAGGMEKSKRGRILVSLLLEFITILLLLLGHFLVKNS